MRLLTNALRLLLFLAFATALILACTWLVGSVAAQADVMPILHRDILHLPYLAKG